MTNLNPSLTPRLLLRSRLLTAIGIFALFGFADSAYLTINHYFALPLPCTVLRGCEVVLTSAYSMVGPIPIAAFGIAFYLLTLLVAAHLYTSNPRAVLAEQSSYDGNPSKKYDRALFALTAIGFVMSIIFESVQAFIIHAFCEYCALSALLSAALFICGVWLLRIDTADDVPHDHITNSN